MCAAEHDKDLQQELEKKKECNLACLLHFKVISDNFKAYQMFNMLLINYEASLN